MDSIGDFVEFTSKGPRWIVDDISKLTLNGKTSISCLRGDDVHYVKIIEENSGCYLESTKTWRLIGRLNEAAKQTKTSLGCHICDDVTVQSIKYKIENTSVWLCDDCFSEKYPIEIESADIRVIYTNITDRHNYLIAQNKNKLCPDCECDDCYPGTVYQFRSIKALSYVVYRYAKHLRNTSRFGCVLCFTKNCDCQETLQNHFYQTIIPKYLLMSYMFTRLNLHDLISLTSQMLYFAGDFKSIP